jgi:hypothetical protein
MVLRKYCKEWRLKSEIRSASLWREKPLAVFAWEMRTTRLEKPKKPTMTVLSDDRYCVQNITVFHGSESIFQSNSLPTLSTSGPHYLNKLGLDLKACPMAG